MYVNRQGCYQAWVPWQMIVSRRSVLEEKMSMKLVKICWFAIAIIAVLLSAAYFMKYIMVAAIALFVIEFFLHLFFYKDTCTTEIFPDNEDEPVQWEVLFRRSRIWMYGMVPTFYIIFGWIHKSYYFVWNNIQILQHKNKLLIYIFSVCICLSIYIIQRKKRQNQNVVLRRKIVIPIFFVIVAVCSFLSLNIALDRTVQERQATILCENYIGRTFIMTSGLVIDEDSRIGSVSIPSIRALLNDTYLEGKTISIKSGEGLFGIPYDGIYCGMVKE